MIIVTGGAGFIGSALIWGLNNRDHNDILVVDHLGTSEKWKNLRSLKYADYYEKDDFISLLEGGFFDNQRIKCIFHLGACSSTTENDASYLMKNNFEYSKKLAKWALNRDIRFIYASSAATYGDGEKGFSDKEGILGLEPLNIYGYSKQIFDQWLLLQGKLDVVVGIKYFNVYGPNEYHKGSMRSFIIKAYEQIQESGKVKLFKSHRPDFKDGEQLRDFIYVKDAVNMTLYFMDNHIGGIYNVATGKARSWNDLVKGVFSALNKEPFIEYIDMPPSIKNQYQYFTCGDMVKLKESGYKGDIFSLEEGIKDYVQNYLIKGYYL